MDVREQLLEQMTVLPQHLQWRVLEFARALAVSTPRGASGKDLAEFAGTISREDAAEMLAAIEEGCENVDEEGW